MVMDFVYIYLVIFFVVASSDCCVINVGFKRIFTLNQPMEGNLNPSLIEGLVNCKPSNGHWINSTPNKHCL